MCKPSAATSVVEAGSIGPGRFDGDGYGAQAGRARVEPGLRLALPDGITYLAREI